MDKKFTNGAKRIFAAMLAVTLLAGTVPYTPVGDMFGDTVLTANATNCEVLTAYRGGSFL